MLDLIEKVINFIRSRTRAQIVRMAAYGFVPGGVFFAAVSGVKSPTSGIDFGKPVTITTLSTEVQKDGTVKSLPGVVVTFEPVDAEYHIPIAGASSMWTSLDSSRLRASQKHLVLQPEGVGGEFPLYDVYEPVTVVVQGRPSPEVWVRGGKERVEGFRPAPRRSLALVSNVVLACVFAFGLSVAKALALDDDDEKRDGKLTADPDQH
jgi:hypothetical protein